METRFDLVDVTLFVNIAESNSLTRGAERSYLSIPSASTRIKNLEDRLGVQLLYRSSHGVTLTPAGQAFLYHGRLVLQQLHNLRGDLHEYAQGKRGHLRISATTSSTTEFLPAILRTYLQVNPDVNVDLRELLSQEIVRAVSNGSTDLGIVSDTMSTQGLEVKPYRHYRYVVVTSLDHPLAKHERVRFEETMTYAYVGLLEASAMHGFLVQQASRISRSLQIRIQVGNFEALCRMIESDIGISVLPEPAARRHAQNMALRIVELSDEWSARTLQICAKSFETLPGFANQLVAMLVEDAARNVSS